MNYSILINGEFYAKVRDIHVESVLDDIDLQGFNVEDVIWDEDTLTVQVTTGEDE